MGVPKCSTCGGNILINTQSGTAVCDSCGNAADIDKATVEKYKSVYETAKRKMRLNSSKTYNEAIEILNGITFVDGVSEDIRICQSRIEEMKASALTQKKIAEQTESNSKKTGTVLGIIIILVVVLLIAAVCLVGYKLVRGELTPAMTCVCIGIAVIVCIAVIAGKTRQ